MYNIQIGGKFHHWTVIGGPVINKNRVKRWTCQCTCGTVKDVLQNALLYNKSKSCGCIKEVSTETRRLLSEIQTGVTHTQATKAKISAKQKMNWEARKTPKQMVAF